MDGATPANEEAAAPAGANQSKDGEETAANQQRDEDSAAANGDAPLQGSSNERRRRSRGSANEDSEPQVVTNDSKEPRAANEDAGHKSPPNQDTAPPSTNQDTAPQAPANQDASPGATANESSPCQVPANQDAPPQDPTNDVAALPAAANQAADPWDWSLEEAWLRAPEGEGLELWGEELEDWEEGPEEEEEEPEVESEGQGAEPAAADHQEAADHWWPSPDGTWSKLIVRPGRGLARPGPGSRCRVLLTVPPSGRWGPASTASGSGCWLTVRPGTAEGRWSGLVDAALETMTSGEQARLRPTGAAVGASITVRLGRFTAPPPFWTSTSSSRWRSATSGHARATALLSQGRLDAAGLAFSRALRAAILAAGPTPPSAELGALKAELHAGLALVQLRLGLPAAAAANAGKALALRPAHLEARFRRGLAQAAMMDLEAAMADLAAVLRAQPGHAGARRELRRVRGAARERDARLARRLGRLFA